jgi:hypothetical protein
MLTAPSGSRFEASADPVTRTIPSAMNMTYGINGYLDSVLANSTADVQWKQRLWENITTVRTVTVSTFLNNHNEIKPYTCFKPDLAGTYSVLLSITDGCSVSNATAVITARCNPPVVVAITSAATDQIDGSKFKRLQLTASISNVNPVETLSYQWSLVGAPADSGLFGSIGSAGKINNNQAPAASFVPDKAGTYTFSFTTIDGCNTPIVVTYSLSLTCNSRLAIQEPVTSPAVLQVTTHCSIIDSPITLE